MNRQIQEKILIITGPTAGGKSKYALEIAQEQKGVIINADSLQLYKDLPILTACPTLEDEQIVSHKLYKMLDANETCSAGQWANLAHQAIQEVIKEKRKPIIVGGSGFYLLALIDGLSPIPDIPLNIRDFFHKELDEKGLEILYENLARRDPILAQKLHPSDKQRILRGLEVFQATGKPLSEWQTMPKIKFPYEFVILVLAPERDKLYERCNQRFLKMIDDGVTKEVQELLQKNIESQKPIMQALGVKEITDYLNNKISLNEAISLTQTKTRQFAKRQITWMRHQFQNAEWIKM